MAATRIVKSKKINGMDFKIIEIINPSTDVTEGGLFAVAMNIEVPEEPTKLYHLIRSVVVDEKFRYDQPFEGVKSNGEGVKSGVENYEFQNEELCTFKNYGLETFY